MQYQTKHSCLHLHTCVKYISGFRCPALLHLTFFFVHFPCSVPFSSCFFIYLSDCNQSQTFAIEWGWRHFAASHWQKKSANHSHRSTSLLIALTFHFSFFLFFFQEIKFRAAGMDSKQTNKKMTPHIKCLSIDTSS